MDERITIVVADDHEVVRQGLRAYLESQPDFVVVGEASSGREAVAAAASAQPQVLLMDLMMPGIDGVEATWQVREASPRTQVVVLTSYHEDEQLFPALRAGAVAYLLKDVHMDELAAALRRAARGETTLHPQVASRLLREIHGGSEQGRNPFSDLTVRELEILRLIAHGLNNGEIADRLFLSEHTVKGHVSNILGKLGLADRTQAAVYAWQHGLVRKETK